MGDDIRGGARRASRLPPTGRDEPSSRRRRVEPASERHSHGLRLIAAVESSRGSFDAAADPGDVVVLTCDGKGIVMRPGELRPETAKAAAKATNKAGAGLGEHGQRDRKRLAEVGAVYEITPAPRTLADIWAPAGDDTTPPPEAANKWVTASVVEDAAAVIAAVFDEAERRDPKHQRQWVALSTATPIRSTGSTPKPPPGT